MHVFEGATADDVWLLAAAKFEDAEAVRTQDSRAGETHEILGTAFTIRNPRERWVVSREPALNPAFAVAEVIWIMCGRQDSAFINYWNPKLPLFAGNAKNITARMVIDYDAILVLINWKEPITPCLAIRTLGKSCYKSGIHRQTSLPLMGIRPIPIFRATYAPLPKSGTAS